MILLDVNLLIYAYSPRVPQHRACLLWLDDFFSGPETIGLPWVTVWGFLRVTSNSRLGGVPQLALERVNEWLSQPGVLIVEPGARHMEILERVILEGEASGPMLSDAVLAALAIENGATLASTDRDFSRFPGLKWVNPLG